jgi:hypothetical protein
MTPHDIGLLILAFVPGFLIGMGFGVWVVTREVESFKE